jgi:ubiquinone/menaquinone biosynthesis C-methylase UbiE
MSQGSDQFVGDIPQTYDHGLGPYLFDGYAADMARRASASDAKAVLEIAAGTGILSRKLRDALPSSTRLTISDLNPPMLDIARGKFRADEVVEFHQADALHLPFAPGAFDLVVCQFGVMFFPDKSASLREAKRVLRAGGRYLFNAWGPMSANPYAQLANEIAIRLFPDDPPGFYKVPFSYYDKKIVTAHLKEAGFSEIQSETVKRSIEVADWAPFARALVHGNPLIDEIRARGSVAPEKVVAAILDGLRQRLGPEPATLPLEAIIFDARSATLSTGD